MQTKQWDKAITEARELQKPEYKYALVTDKGAERSAYVTAAEYRSVFDEALAVRPAQSEVVPRDFTSRLH